MQPKYEIVYSYPVSIQDNWGGYETTEMKYEKEKKAAIPQSLTVRIHLKWIDNIQNAKLEINETTLLFEYPELYYLDLNLKYKVDESRSKAKFDKSKS